MERQLLNYSRLYLCSLLRRKSFRLYLQEGGFQRSQAKYLKPIYHAHSFIVIIYKRYKFWKK